MSKLKPIRVFWSPLSKRFYASQHYRTEREGVILVTGVKYDVTDDIGFAVVKHEIEFTEIKNHQLQAESKEE